MSKASLLELCHGEKKYVILNKQVKYLTSQYIGTCKSAYTKGYALNRVLTLNNQEPCKILNYVARYITTTYNNFIKF